MTRYTVTIRGELSLTTTHAGAWQLLVTTLDRVMGSYRPDTPREVAARLLDGLDNPATVSTHWHPEITVTRGV